MRGSFRVRFPSRTCGDLPESCQVVDGRVSSVCPLILLILDANPVVGYSKLRDGVRLLVWSG
jgi:hypothetical protein